MSHWRLTATEALVLESCRKRDNSASSAGVSGTGTRAALHLAVCAADSFSEISVPTVDLDVGGFLFPLAVSLQRQLFHSSSVFHTSSLTCWTTVGHACSIFSRSVREHKHVWKVRLAYLKNVALEHRVASPAVTLSADFFT